MSYDELKKIYYKNQSQWENEYRNRFESKAAIHIDFKIGDDPAFFVETNEVLHLLLDIERKDKQVIKLSDSLPGIALNQYTKKCLIDEIVVTNNIEGVSSSRKEIGEVLDLLEEQSAKRNHVLRFEGMVNKYIKLIRGEMTSPQTCQELRSLYDEVFLKEVMEEDPKNRPDGKIFRKSQESIYSSTGKEIHRGVYPEDKIIESVETALDFLHDESIDILYRICVFHYLLEYIHPFHDGNGRLGRLIFSQGISEHLESLLAYRISKVIKENINRYYSSFKTCNEKLNRGDLTPFLIMMLKMIVQAQDQLIDSLTERLVRMNRYGFLIDQFDDSGNENIRTVTGYLIQASLFSEEGLSSKEIMDLMGIRSYTTLTKLMNQLPQEYLRSKTRNRVRYYELDLDRCDELLMNRENRE